jgi:hypothetical protein
MQDGAKVRIVQYGSTLNDRMRELGSSLLDVYHRLHRWHLDKDSDL